jgi:hypothetical protein
MNITVKIILILLLNITFILYYNYYNTIYRPKHYPKNARDFAEKYIQGRYSIINDDNNNEEKKSDHK